MTEDWFFGWLTGFGGVLMGFFLAELTIALRHLHGMRKVKQLEKIMPSMLELNRRVHEKPCSCVHGSEDARAP